MEVFGGTCCVSRAYADRGLTAESFEIDRDLDEDVMNKINSDSMFSRIRRGEFCLVWAGIPCASWSRARCGHPPHLRGENVPEIWGLPDLSDKDNERVRMGFCQVRWLARIVFACIKSNTPVILENLASSRLWKAPPFLNLLRKCSSRIFHHCMFGSAHMKPTRLMFQHISLDGVIRRCSGPRGICARTGLPHEVLRGTGSKGTFKTARASAYPFELFRPSCSHNPSVFKPYPFPTSTWTLVWE